MRAYKILKTREYFEYGGNFTSRNFCIIFPEIEVKIPVSERYLHDITSNEDSNGFSFFNNARKFDETDSDFDKLNDLSIGEWKEYMEGKQGLLEIGWKYACEPFDVDNRITEGLLRKIETDEQMRPLDDTFKQLFLESLHP